MLGWLLVALGVWMHLRRDELFFTHLIIGKAKVVPAGPTEELPVAVFENLPFLLIGVGAFVVIMSFLGCCGSCAESVCFLGFVSSRV